MKTKLFLLAMLAMMINSLTARADDSGTCGENLTWKYEETTQTLTISGSGVMENYSWRNTCPWSIYKESIAKVIIQDGVTNISNEAFIECRNLTTAIIPNSVTRIGESAFSDCSGLTSINIPNSVISIAIRAFYYCSGLTSLTIPNSVTSIENFAFAGCSGLTSINIPNNVTSIAIRAFAGCRSLTSVTIPNGVTSIENSAFEGCSGLTSINIPNNVTSIEDGAFEGCCGLTYIAIPNSVTSIEDYAFRNCTGLISITIPNSVTSIRYNAFSGCSSLISITIPNSVTTIEKGAFYGCQSLTSIIIPNSVTSIGEHAFSYCTSMNEVFAEMENPFILNVSVFPEQFKSEGTLYVPTGTRQYYIERGWGNSFFNIAEIAASETIWLSIIDAEQGRTLLKCEPGKSYTFRFKASDGWNVHSVTYHGNDVTDWLTEDGEFTTPAISTSTELIVTYEQESDDVKTIIPEMKARVVVADSDIIVKNAPIGTPIRIYDLSGRLITTAIAGDHETRVEVGSNADVVIVKVGERAMKAAR